MLNDAESETVWLLTKRNFIQMKQGLTFAKFFRKRKRNLQIFLYFRAMWEIYFFKNTKKVSKQVLCTKSINVK